MQIRSLKKSNTSEASGIFPTNGIKYEKRFLKGGSKSLITKKLGNEIEWLQGHLKKVISFSRYALSVSLTDLKKDWIEQPIVLAPTKLKPAAPSCWDHFRGKGYYVPWVK